MRQLLSTGVQPWQLALGRFGSSALTLGAVCVPPTVVGMAALVLSQGVSAVLPAPERLAWLGAVYALYLGTVLSIALGVSAALRSARSALLVLLAWWVCACMLVPRVAADVAVLVAPAPSLRSVLAGDRA